MHYRTRFPIIYRQLAAEVEKRGLEQLKREAASRLRTPRIKGGRWPVLNQSQEARNAIDRFLVKITVNKNTDCWEWTTRIGTICKSYGALKIRKRSYKAPTVAFALFVGPIPVGLCVCHRCDNPPCVNPRHLFLGTQRDNVRDCWDKGRRTKIRDQNGEANCQAKLTERDVKHFRNHYRPPMDKWAKRYGVSQQLLYRVLSREIWKHIW